MKRLNKQQLKKRAAVLKLIRLAELDSYRKGAR